MIEERIIPTSRTSAKHQDLTIFPTEEGRGTGVRQAISEVNSGWKDAAIQAGAVWKLRCSGLAAGSLFIAVSGGTGFDSAAAVAASNQIQTISVPCDFEFPRLRTVADSTQISVVNCDNWERVGEPALPFRTIRVLLPPAADVTQVQAQAEETPEVLAGEWRVEHGRMPIRFPGPNAQAAAPSPADQPAPAIYLSDAPFPRARAELASVQRMGGYDIAFVRVFPVEYAPLSGKLTFASRLVVKVSVAALGQRTGQQMSLSGLGRARQDAAAMVNNPDMLTAYAVPAMLGAPSPAVYDYLLITRSNLVSAFQPLVNQKAADGLAVKVETVQNILASQTGRDQPEKIRNYIRYAYTNWGITYVLLGGDTTIVPARYAYAYMSTLESGRFPRHLPACDLYYACLDGSWDKDADGTFGEPTDGETGGEVDLLAEVYVGRAPVDTVAEVSTFVEKTVRYETQAHGRATNALFIAEYLGSAGGFVAQGWDMFIPLTNYFAGFQQTRLDDSPFTTPQWSYLDALRELNRSPHLALFAGHGDPNTMMGLIADDLDTLTNQWPILAYSVSCDSGAFDNDAFFDPFDCIGEELVKHHSRAAFAAILNSREGWYDVQTESKWSGEFQIKFFEESLKQGRTRLGVANQFSKQAMLGKIETSGLMIYRFCCFEINLLGDPHVALQVPPAAAQLIVSSVWGGTTPPAGTNQYPVGTPLLCSVANSPLPGGAGMQYVCTGWSGTGSTPASGSTTQVSFALNTASQITWAWKTQIWFTTGVSGNGSLNVESGWQNKGETLQVQATPADYYHFARWTGDVTPGSESNATLSITVTQPRTLTATFAANLTTSGTPEWWLASYGWTNQFETVALADADQDGVATWAEFVAGTDPRDAASALRLSVATGSGPADRVLSWPSVADRRYAIYRAGAPGGLFLLLTDDLPATPPLNTFTDSAAGTAAFYRVGVTNMP